MNLNPSILAAILAVPVFVALTAGAPVASACSQAMVVPELHTASFGGSTQIPVSAPDDSWFVVSTPSSSVVAPAFSIDDHPAWIQTTANPVWYANWINAVKPGGPFGGNTPLAPVGTYVYAVKFTLTPADIAAHPTFTLATRYAADDAVTFSVNSGPAFGGPGSFAAWSSASYTGVSGTDFVPGTNVLYAKVTNTMLWTGLLVVGMVQGDC